jgi:hypothetical protein
MEDLYLISDKGEIEHYFFFYATHKIPPNFPHIYSANRLVDLASNENIQWINQYSLTTEQAKSQYHAEWANEAGFKPKTSFSVQPRCRQFAMYRQSVGLILAYTCYNDEIIDYQKLKSPIVFRPDQ